MNFLKQLWQLGESFAVRLEKNRLLLISGFTVLYAVFTYVLAKRKPLWNDELYTYYIARLPAMTDVWGALMSGSEQLPPFLSADARFDRHFRSKRFRPAAAGNDRVLDYVHLPVCLRRTSRIKFLRASGSDFSARDLYVLLCL